MAFIPRRMDTDLDVGSGENQEFDFKYFKPGIFVKTSK